eukprot:GSChrysophyteH1.ASY1.ANO1.1051.1 assembled CDS
MIAAVSSLSSLDVVFWASKKLVGVGAGVWVVGAAVGKSSASNPGKVVVKSFAPSTDMVAVELYHVLANIRESRNPAESNACFISARNCTYASCGDISGNPKFSTVVLICKLTRKPTADTVGVRVGNEDQTNLVGGDVGCPVGAAVGTGLGRGVARDGATVGALVSSGPKEGSTLGASDG